MKGEAARFLELLLTLLKEKTSLFDSLYILARDGVDKAVRDIAVSVLSSMKKGKSFSESLRRLKSGRVFYSPVYLTLISAAELAGSLETVLERVISDLRRLQAARDNAVNVLIYPAIIVLLAVAGTIALIVKGMPLLISDGFLSAGVVQDAKTGIGIAALVLLSGGGALFVVYYRIFYRETPEFRIFYLLDFLLHSNVALPEALSHCVVSMEGTKFSKALIAIKKDIAQGVSFSSAFGRIKQFSPYVRGWLSVAASRGSLNEVTGSIRDYFDNRDSKTRETAARLMEPAVIVLTGSYVLIIMVTVVLPILTFTGGSF
ncbi:MAG: type II secretion system F family protein [Treponema sp.]|jgi:type IV pilus assembly protein PilC|nr:type II secretion system F family protein [Treponema sp.]